MCIYVCMSKNMYVSIIVSINDVCMHMCMCVCMHAYR